jgi:hypothetical protein
VGSGGIIASAAWAELYGPQNVGAVRRVAAAGSVLAGATSPVVFGRLLDAGYVFKDILTGSLVLLLVASVLAAVGCCSGFLAGTQGERSPELRA